MVKRPRVRAPYGARSYYAWRLSTKVTWWWRGRWRGIGLPTWELFSFDGPIPVSRKKGEVRPMPKMPSKPGAGPESRGANRGGWATTLPNLSEWLCCACWEDGVPIGPVQLQLRREGSIIRATLKISDQGGLRLSAIEESPQDALLALDLLLGAVEAPWEVDAYPLQGPKPRRK